MNPQEQATLYRQSLEMLFCKEIANKTRIMYRESTKGNRKIFWVNRAFRGNNGEIILSPTGWKSYSPKELEEEAGKFFRESRADDTKRDFKHEE